MKKNTKADVAAIEQLIGKYCQAANDGDLNLFMSLWDDEAIRLEPDQPSIIGKEEIRKYFEISFSQFG